MFYTATQLETLDRQLGGQFKFPPGEHTIESKDGQWWLWIIVRKDGTVAEALQMKRA